MTALDRSKLILAALASLLALTLTGCSGGDDTAGDEEANDAIAESEAYYAAHPDFFRFATPEDLPDGLEWEDGSELPEFSSPEAKRGGTWYNWFISYPRTLRRIGPDASGTFRPFLLDDYSLCVVEPHPNIRGAYYPGLANAWSIDWENNRVFFKLDPNARYSDGVQVTADDYLFMFYFMQQDYHQEPWSTNWYRIGETYTNITKYDDFTISIGLAEMKPDVFRLFEEDIAPKPRHFFKNYGPDYVERYQWKFEPTTGPYVILDKDIKKGRTIALTRLDDWWADEKPFWRHRFNPDRIQFQTIRDTDKALEAFRKGELDAFEYMTVPEFWHLKFPNDAPEVQNGYIAKYKQYTDKPRPNYGVWLNKSKPLLDNHDIRVGIAYALNLQLAIDQIFRGDYERSNTFAEGYGRYTNTDIKARPFSAEKALESFAKAGFTERGPDGILVNDQGQRLSFELSNGRPQLEAYITILKEEAVKAGLEIRIKNMDFTTAAKQWQEKNHEMALTAYNVSVELYPRFFDFFHSFNALTADGKPKPTTNNLTVTAYPEWDKLIERYDSSMDLDEIKDISWKLQELIHEDAAYIPAHKVSYYRVALWRWIKFPKEFDTRVSNVWDQFRVAWIDEEEKAKTLEAMKNDETFEPTIKVFDEYRVGE